MFLIKCTSHFVLKISCTAIPKLLHTMYLMNCNKAPNVLSDDCREEVLCFKLLEMEGDEEGSNEDETTHQERVGDIVASNRFMT